MHIGLIGGIGPGATVFYYRGLVDAHAAQGRALDLTIAQAEGRDLVANLTAGDGRRQADIFCRLIERLAAAGAEIAAVTSMGGHFCIRELSEISPLPLLNLIPEMAAALQRLEVDRVGLIGTRTVMESRLYGAVPSLEIVLPEGDDLAATHDAYVTMARAGRITEAQRELFFRVGAALCRDQGAEVVVLGGTDLCLAFEGVECGFPVLDCARVHVDALVKASFASAPLPG